jgi:hypothetical protein
MRILFRGFIAGVLFFTSSLFLVEATHAAAACSPASSDSGGVRTLVFTNTATCTWTVPANVTSASTILIVGGGGGAGYYGNAGGGGAGALVVTTNFAMTPGATFDIYAGTGGAGSTAGAGSNGTASSFGGVIATGGGGGAGGDGTNGTAVNNGKLGGSGGGGSSYNGALNGLGAGSNASVGITSPWTAYGNSGADGSSNVGGGGGGAGSAGGVGTRGTGGAGRPYFGNVYAKGGSGAQSVNQLVSGSGNGGNVISTGGTGSSGSVTIQYTIPIPIFAYASTTQTTSAGVAFATNTITSTGTPIVSYSISPSLPSGVTLNSSTGQLSGAPTVLLSPTLFTVTATDSGAMTGTSTLTLSVTTGPASISLSPLTGNFLKGTNINIVATVNTSGKVRFYANGKRIPNCLAVPTVTSGSITATCSWKPPVQSSLKISATITPFGNVFTSATSLLPAINIAKRANPRS